MTRKDYELIAATLKNQHRIAANVSPVGAAWVEYTTMNLALAFTQDNPRFDRERFVKAATS